MKNNNPFEKQWQDKLKAGLTKIGKADLFNDIIEHIQTDDRVEWNRQLMTLLSANLSEAEIKLVMCSCACLAPKDNLAHIRDEYVKTKNIPHVHAMLQQQFEIFIRQYKKLDDNQMNFLRENGWGMAGKLRDNVIYATKIPKDFHNYFSTDDQSKKSYYYCHCPRIHEMLGKNEKTIDANYCYCGAGYYKDLWEYITQNEVKVEIIKSIMDGDDVCQIAIYL